MNEIDKTVKKQSKSNNPDGNPKWKKGIKSPNPNGRPKGSSHLKCLEEAMNAKGKAKKRTLWEHAVDRAYMNDSVLIAIIKKFIPDKSATEMDFKGDGTMVVRFKNSKDK